MFWNLVAESICNRVTSEKPLGVGGVVSEIFWFKRQ